MQSELEDFLKEHDAPEDLLKYVIKLNAKKNAYLMALGRPVEVNIYQDGSVQKEKDGYTNTN